MKEQLCNVCRVNKAKGVYASRIAPVSLAYCESCLNKGAEAYNVLVTTAALSKLENPDYQIEMRFKEIVTATLEVTGSTLEEFNRDVEIELQGIIGAK